MRDEILAKTREVREEVASHQRMAHEQFASGDMRAYYAISDYKRTLRAEEKRLMEEYQTLPHNPALDEIYEKIDAVYIAMQDAEALGDYDEKDRLYKDLRELQSENAALMKQEFEMSSRPWTEEDRLEGEDREVSTNAFLVKYGLESE